jgi:CPA1 family monovalent cation:H+ antiporter
MVWDIYRGLEISRFILVFSQYSRQNRLSMSFYPLLSVLILLAAIFSYVNYKLIKWPQTIGIMILSLLSSLLIVFLGPHSATLEIVGKGVAGIDFNTILMKIMLGFLLFAGGFHIDASCLREQGLPVIVLSTVGTILSTFIVGGLAYYTLQAFGYPIPFIHCLLFGAIISPTDPIAVLGILKSAKIPHSLELKIAGESLFNDGVAIVIFLTVLELATSPGQPVSVASISFLFLKEAVGGVVYGLLLGWVGNIVLRTLDNYQVEILITIAIVMAGYSFADVLHVSGPLAMVVTGLVTGNAGKKHAMSEQTRDYLSKFWELVDEILNAVLFMLIGLEMLIVRIDHPILLIGVLMIFIVLLARWVSVLVPLSLLRKWVAFEKHATLILTWGGLRGGISVALALSLPSAFHRDEFVSVTYIIVIFSIIVQGLTIGRLARKLA